MRVPAAWVKWRWYLIARPFLNRACSFTTRSLMKMPHAILPWVNAIQCFTDGDTASKEDIIARGGNSSMIHVDWMIGSQDINIDGIREGSACRCYEMGNGRFHEHCRT